MYSKSGVGYILVLTNATHKHGTGKFGIDGKEIVVDIDFKPMEYAFNHATVYQLPVDMGNHAIMQIPCGSPAYGPIGWKSEESSPSTDLYAIGGVYKYKYVSDIEQDVQIGDKIYFKPRTLNNKKNFMGMLKDESGKVQQYIYKVPYENIFCAVRDDQVIPIGAWIMIEPMWEDYEDILIPTYYPYKDKFDQPIERPKKEWISKKLAPEQDNMCGMVAHVGKPLKGDTCDIKQGMRVLFRRQLKPFAQTIEGQKYTMISQDMVLGELLENVKVK